MRLRKNPWVFALAAASAFACGCETTPQETTPITTEPEPESVCLAWADASCANLGTCCTGEEQFDELDCSLELSNACMEALAVELVHAGAMVFDEDAAETCLTPVTSCSASDFTIGDPAQEEACYNTLTGFRPPGSGCQGSYECLRPETGHGMCYGGTGELGVGVCATVATSSDGKCRFDKETFVVTVCPTGTFCDPSTRVSEPSTLPSDEVLAFVADCVPYRAAGEVCIEILEDGYREYPCASGLKCIPDLDDVVQFVCAVPVPVGGPCTFDEQCVDGASCDYVTSTCKAGGGGALFCHAPPVCGDGACQSGEDEESCPADCGYCGDGYCGPYEEWCYDDCGYCGDWYCDWDEEDQMTCPEDCEGYCGDGYCGAYEDASSCGADCGSCGDGICADDEWGTCTADCAEACMSCGEFLTNGTGLDQLCTDNGPPSSYDLYAAWVDCACFGACAEACADNVCQGGTATDACVTCILSTSTGCGNEFNECANDL